MAWNIDDETLLAAMAAYEKYGSLKQAGNFLGCSGDAVKRRIAEARRRGLASSETKQPAAKAPKLSGLNTEATTDVIERETLDPIPAIVNVCNGMPDGVLATSEELRKFLEMSKSQWKELEADSVLTAFRCRVPKKGASGSYLAYFGNDREISKLKKLRGVKDG